MITSLIPALFMPFLGSIFSIFASAASVLSNAFSVIAPLLAGLVQFAVWFVKSFFIGLGNIIQNLNVLTVIIVVLAAALLYQHSIDTKRLVDQVQQQRNYDAKHPPKVIKPIHPKKLASTDIVL